MVRLSILPDFTLKTVLRPPYVAENNASVKYQDNKYFDNTIHTKLNTINHDTYKNSFHRNSKVQRITRFFFRVLLLFLFNAA